MKKHLFDVQVEQIKKYLFKKNRALSIYKLSRTEYKKLAHFLHGVSVLGRVLEQGIKNWPISRTGCQFGVLGGTYPPKRYPSAPPPPGEPDKRLIQKHNFLFRYYQIHCTLKPPLKAAATTEVEQRQQFGLGKFIVLYLPSELIPQDGGGLPYKCGKDT